MKKNRILAARRRRGLAALAPPPALADLTIGVSISLTGPTSALGIPTQERHRALAEGDRRREAQRHRPRRRDRPDQGRAEHAQASSPRTRSTSIVGSVATPVAAAMADVCRRGQDGAAHALAGEPAARQGRLVVPHAAVDRGDGDPDRRALEEDSASRRYGFLGYADALRRGLADRHQAARREGRHQARRRRALRAQRHRGHRPGAQADRRPTPTRSSSSPRAAARRCRTRRWSSAATRRARSTRRTARRRWT